MFVAKYATVPAYWHSFIYNGFKHCAIDAVVPPRFKPAYGKGAQGVFSDPTPQNKDPVVF